MASPRCLYAPGSAALAALGGTGISVMVGGPNNVLPDLATRAPAAAAGSAPTSRPTRPSHSVVGNEVAGSDTRYVGPAMENVHIALVANGLGGAINVTMAISQATIAIHVSPSASEFTNESKPFMIPVLQFLLLHDVVDVDHNLHPLLEYLPSSAPTLEQTPSQRGSPRTQVHREDAAPLRHPCLNRLVSTFIPNHRTAGLIRDGSEESLFSAVIVAAKAKTMNNLKT
ncbi:lichenase-2-like [Aegilops tauschii subsp. strangulata]|uniref:lichenase-2-like n=1 Tax=Aegilops tauschii subsp. strangulata TaxID=200361 RepID=UPI001ABCF43B|nr:lichenase-2-like [Aegilops tauschii subsp. strangulata]